MESALLKSYLELAGPQVIQNEGGVIALVDAQTGLGKTYQATALQIEHLFHDSKKTIIYATNLRINVYEAYQDLICRIENHPTFSLAQKQRMLSNIIRIPSQETSIKAISEEDWQLLLACLDPNDLRKVRQIREGIKLLSNAYQAHANNQLGEELSERYSKLFRLIQSIFRDKLNNNEISKSSSEYQVLTKIFPACLMKDDTTQVLFMTTAKMLFPWHALEKNYRINDVLKDSLIILDEFDRQQGEFLNHLLRETKEFDVISLVRRLYASFKSFKVQGDEEFDGVDRSFDKFRERLNEFNEKWCVNYRPYITNQTIQAGLENQNRIFTMLSDRMSLHAINFKHNELTSNIDDLKGGHEIGEAGTQSSIPFINNGSRVLRAFCNGMLSATNKLSTNLAARNAAAHSTEDLVVKILNHFGLAELRYDVLRLLSIRLSFRSKNGHKSYSYHDSGFEIARISKFDGLDNTAKAATFELALTPTGLLANWVLEGAKILGISATASSKTAIHNFDLAYLKGLLVEQFKELSPENKALIQQEYLSRRQYKKNNVNIIVSEVSERSLRGGVHFLYREYLNQDIDDLLLERELMVLLDASFTSIGFAVSRANKLIYAIKKFSEHPNNRYQFCMLNKSYRGQEFFDFMTFLGNKFKVQIFANINAASFRNDQFNAVLNVLEKTNDKVVVITNYQATGAGLSPSYQLADTNGLIYIGPKDEAPIQQKTDIDSIYIEEPKSLIGHFIHPEQTAEERNIAVKKNIHDALMLHEQNLITANDIKPILNRFIASNRSGAAVGSMIQFYKGTEDYRHAIRRFTEQALGRMCRTEWKQPEITIMFDAELSFVQTLAGDNRDLNFLSEEYRLLITKVKQDCLISMTGQQRTAYSAKASRNHSHIQRLVNSVYNMQNSDSIGQYNRLRNMVLMAPTVTSKPDGEAYRYYLNLDKAINTEGGRYAYSISDLEEGGVTQIFINPADQNTTRSVSGEAARLDKLMQNEVVKDHFKSNNFATSFGTGEYVMAPAMFDIYMGAIGEEAVFSLLKEFNYKVHGMPHGIVEWFDGYIEVGNFILLLDVKHWDTASTSIKQDNTTAKCKDKLRRLRANLPAEFIGKAIKALYVNTFFESVGVLTGSSIATNTHNLIKAAGLLEADIIDVPGVIDAKTGQSNVVPMQQLLSLFHSLKGIAV